MAPDVMESRRAVMAGGPYVVMDSFKTYNTNSSATWSTTNYTGGDLTVTPLNPTTNPSNPVAYQNGYMTIYSPALENNKDYVMTADVTILANPLDSDAIALAPYGVGANAVNGHIRNGKLIMLFNYKEKTGTTNKTLEIRVGGKTMTMSNIQFWTH